MKKHLLPLLFLCITANQMLIAGDIFNAKDPYNKTFTGVSQNQLHYDIQSQMRQSNAWISFKNSNPKWSVTFDEKTGMPQRAYGPAFQLPYSGDAVSQAQNFFSGYLSAFNIPVSDLVLRNSSESKYQYIDFYQTYQGLEVLFSRATVRMTLNNEVVMFGLDVYNNIQISAQGAISENAIIPFAQQGIAYNISQSVVTSSLKILPVPTDKNYDFHLVYEVIVYCTDNDGFPANYYTLVDANNGEVLYRHNLVDNCFQNKTVLSSSQSSYNTISKTPTVIWTKEEGESVPIDIYVEATVSTQNPYIAETVQPIRNLKITVQGNDFYTDSLGFIHLPNTSNVNATVHMEGTWSQVMSGNTSTNIVTFPVSLTPGLNTISLDANSDDRMRSAYYHVNIVHDYMKSKLPLFTGLDTNLPTRVERTDGNCNAFYDGASINFYTHSTGCYSLSLCGDVVYHEYGHGIDDLFYTSQGGNWQNGAMGEGYSDVWGLAITNNPLLGIGISDTDPTAVVRRYDINPKVYPQDIVGEVHADGEIICGAWWDTRVNIGGATTDSMMALFSEALFGLANGPDGTEGTVFRNVLLDCLMADDDNGNINDGTPHDVQILTAFAKHGITLLANIDLQHTQPVTANFNVPLTVDADVTVDFPIYLGDIIMHYKTDTTSAWDSTVMTLSTGTTYSANLSAQTQGQILDYYFTVTDIFNDVALTQPGGVIDTPYANLAYKLMVGYVQLHKEDFDNIAGNWQVNVNGTDDNTTGTWTLDSPNATFLTGGNAASICQTGTDHTEDNTINFCYFTGQGTTATSIGENDVDGGRTSLFSPVFDLSAYTNPAISFYQWYSNAQGANPRNDLWRVYISNDQTTWHRLEFTNYPDRSWRNYAFRVTDYLPPTSQVQLMFIASDSVIAGMGTTNGGSVVEAAVDDLIIWEEGIPNNINQINNTFSIQAYPNPANDILMISLPEVINQPVQLQLINNLGQVIKEITLPTGSEQKWQINTSSISQGLYVLRAKNATSSTEIKITIFH